LLFSHQQRPRWHWPSYLFIAPALVYLSAWFLLGTISQKPLVRIMPALVLALSPLVMELQHRGGVVELTALVSVMLTARLLVSSANAFSPARSWRWVALGRPNWSCAGCLIAASFSAVAAGVSCADRDAPITGARLWFGSAFLAFRCCSHGWLQQLKSTFSLLLLPHQRGFSPFR
jgi:hypothetical protein